MSSLLFHSLNPDTKQISYFNGEPRFRGFFRFQVGKIQPRFTVPSVMYIMRLGVNKSPLLGGVM